MAASVSAGSVSGSHRQRLAKAIDAMEALELSRHTIIKLVKQLLKTYDNEWEFIEAENYRLLADAAFEQQEAQASTTPSSGPVTRARRANPEADATEDSEDSQPLSPDRASNCRERPDPEGPSAVRTENSPALSRSDAALPANIIRGMEYHSGTNVRKRAVCSHDYSSQAGQGTEGHAAHVPGREKGKSPLEVVAKDCRRPPLREDRREGNLYAGQPPKLVEVKREVNPASPVPEGFEKVAFERVDGKIVPAVKKPQNEVNPVDENLVKCKEEKIEGVVERENLLEQTVADPSNNLQIVLHGGFNLSPPPEPMLLLTAGPVVEQSPTEEDVVTSLVDYCSEEDEAPSSSKQDVSEVDNGLHSKRRKLEAKPSAAAKSDGDIARMNKDVRATALPAAPARRRLILPDESESLHESDLVSGDRGKGTGLAVGSSKPPLKRVKIEPGLEGPSESVRPLHAQQSKKKKPRHDPADISRGTERVAIPFVNDFTSETIPSNFQYIASNVIFQAAYINISLARVGDEDSCRRCIGNCLDTPIGCFCTRETAGEFAYTHEGLLKPSYIQHEMDMIRSPSKKKLTYCQWDCPIERAKMKPHASDPDSCKGHLQRKFVKECWHKCGCGMQCGNRVVQRGVTRSLQVFFTKEGKGWGLRTTEDLPKGAFVCEYVGEILTNMELDKRNQDMKNATQDHTKKHKDTYPVTLDGDWCSEEGLKDEEALCLDGTNYGNVARFINHRCSDANLIDIPVTVESQDRHYYHIAFFTNRSVPAGDELTWDYSIDFEDKDHPIEAFECLCKSEFCRGAGAGASKKPSK